MRISRRMRSCNRCSPALIFTLLSLSSTLAAAVETADASAMIYNFNKLTPSTSLNWTSCFDNFTCALLEVPLDYGNPSIGKTAIAFTKYASPNQPTEDLLLNFGGPGASGVGMVLSYAPVFAEVYGPKYNLVGFDPRGVNNSGPGLDCFPGDPETRNNFESAYYRLISDASSDSVTTQYYLGKAHGKWCSRVIGGVNGTGRYASTPAVANDLLAYAEANNVLSGQPKEEAKLNYYGYSYGTVLGATFASLFPNRIGRMVLDGVDDAENYYNGTWSVNLYQADEAVNSFFTTCSNAGLDLCPFWESTPDKIASRLQKLLDSIKANPIPVVDPSVMPMPLLATYSDLKKVLLNAMYFPLLSFPQLAQILVDLEQGNGSSLITAAKLQFGCDPDEQDTGPDQDDSGIIIGCIDGTGNGNITSSLFNYQSYVNLLRNQSKWLGDTWGSNVYTCNSMDVAPPLSGKFPSPLPPSAKNTSWPILFINNAIDPVTPIVGAHKMADAFPGFYFIEQNSVGHTSLAAPSKCTYGYLQDYFDGKALPKNVTCPDDGPPFKDAGWPDLTELRKRNVRKRELGQRELRRAVQRLWSRGLGGRKWFE